MGRGVAAARDLAALRRGLTRAQVDQVFTALADPNRRRLIEALAIRGGVTATGLAADLPITRQAVSKHLGILGSASLVSSERVGRETQYKLEPAPLGEAAAWMGRVGSEWDGRLVALQDLFKG